jgi:hypothetical protein
MRAKAKAILLEAISLDELEYVAGGLSRREREMQELQVYGGLAAQFDANAKQYDAAIFGAKMGYMGTVQAAQLQADATRDAASMQASASMFGSAMNLFGSMMRG